MLKFGCAVVYLSMIAGAVYGFHCAQGRSASHVIESAYLIQPAANQSWNARKIDNSGCAYYGLSRSGSAEAGQRNIYRKPLSVLKGV